MLGGAAGKSSGKHLQPISDETLSSQRDKCLESKYPNISIGNNVLFPRKISHYVAYYSVKRRLDNKTAKGKWYEKQRIGSGGSGAVASSDFMS